MATGLNVNGKIVKRPGVYAYILSGIQNPPLTTSYGNVVIIDDGIGAGFGGGSGVNGLLKQGKDSIYDFTSIQDFQAFAKGGELWNLAQPLFKPILNNPQIQGISKLTFIRACTTTPASTTVALTNGNVIFKTKDEGLNANGALTSGVLTSGYGALLIASPATPGMYRLNIYHSTFKGLDPLNNAPYDNIAAIDTTPMLVVQSPDVLTVGQLSAWMQTDVTFNQGFTWVSSTVPTTTTTTTAATTTTTTTGGGTTTTTTTSTTTLAPLGIILPGDVTGTYFLAAGGTETYNAQSFTDALNAVKDCDNNFFLCTKYFTDYNHANNVAIFNFITSGDSKFEKMMVVAAGYAKADLTVTTNAAAQYYNNDRVIVSHSGGKKPSRNIGGFTLYSQLHVAANALGRLAGLTPQTPLTWKTLDYSAMTHVINDNEKDYCLDNGILVASYDAELSAVVILQDINTLQNNDYLINEDSTSFNIAIKRIVYQINREIIIGAKKTFFGNQTQGANRNTVSAIDVEMWLVKYLQSRLATPTQDNLILGFKDIVVTTSQDNVTVTYKIGVNSEISKILFVGTLITI